MSTNRITKIFEILFSILSVIGALLVSSTIVIGWPIWIVASSFGVVWGLRTKNYFVSMMNIFFTITNIIGTYNYLLSPYLSNT